MPVPCSLRAVRPIFRRALSKLQGSAQQISGGISGIAAGSDTYVDALTLGKQAQEANLAKAQAAAKAAQDAVTATSGNAYSALYGPQGLTAALSGEGQYLAGAQQALGGAKQAASAMGNDAAKANAESAKAGARAPLHLLPLPRRRSPMLRTRWITRPISTPPRLRQPS